MDQVQVRRLFVLIGLLASASRERELSGEAHSYLVKLMILEAVGQVEEQFRANNRSNSRHDDLVRLDLACSLK